MSVGSQDKNIKQIIKTHFHFDIFTVVKAVNIDSIRELDTPLVLKRIYHLHTTKRRESWESRRCHEKIEKYVMLLVVLLQIKNLFLEKSLL